jgi:CheY-specific phosphatase CheX
LAEACSPAGVPSLNSLLGVLKESVREVFETMVIAYAEAAGEEHVAGTEGTEARIEFHGPLSGAVVVRCSTSGAESIARSLLMMEPDEPVELEDVRDSLGECTNLITGRMKTVALDPHGAFTMGTPQVETHLPRDGERHLGMLVFRLEAGALAAEIWLAEREPGASAA